MTRALYSVLAQLQLTMDLLLKLFNPFRTAVVLPTYDNWQRYRSFLSSYLWTDVKVFLLLR